MDCCIIVGKQLVVMVVFMRIIIDDLQYYQRSFLCDLLLGHLCLHVSHLFADQHHLFGCISLASYLDLEDLPTSYCSSDLVVIEEDMS